MNIRIEKINKLGNWKEWEIEKILFNQKNENCICCNNSLKTLASIEKIRVGCCDRCGYVGYQDRPSEKWIVDFYSNIWNKEIEEKLVGKPNKKVAAESNLIKAIKSLEINKTGPICEIGCGYGGMLVKLLEMGFTNLTGVENSKERTRISREEGRAEILNGNFEGEDVHSSLKEKGVFDLIYSSHVLEHTANPRKIIEKASELQKEGGYIIIAVPNFIGEPAMGVLFFLPHLHSFTIPALSLLLESNKYKVLSSTYSTNTEILIVARKENNLSVHVSGNNFFNKAKQKIVSEMKLDRVPLNTPVRFLWSKKQSSLTKTIPLNKSIIRRLLLLISGENKKFQRSINFTKTSQHGDELRFSFKIPPVLFYK